MRLALLAFPGGRAICYPSGGYTPEQLLAISARQSVSLTQKEFARLLNVSVDSVQDWEQGPRSPRGAARTLLHVARNHPEVLENLAS